MKRRKDNKGKVLKEGESQRKDGLYQYRWTDKFGKRHSVYAGSLKELREKENDILIKVALNKNLNGSKTSVINLVETYYSIREHSWKKGTKKERKRYLKLLSQLEFGQRIISDISYSDALLWTKELYESTGGEYSGIGAVMSQNTETGVITLVQIYKDSPAEKAGLKENDILYKVEGKEVTGKDLSKVVSKVKGEKGTTVELTVLRGEDAKEVTVTATRDTVQAQTIEYKMMDDKIGYIRVSEFDTVTYDQYKEALDDLEKQGMTGLVVDLRNNPGGSLSTVCDMLDLMLPKGLIVYTEDKNGKKTEMKSDEEHQFTKPLAVLVNGNSASASEIYSGAIQDYGIGKIVGTQTYGKGVVQQIFDLDDGTAVKLTIAEYFTPKGRSINGKGITPDVKVEYENNEENPDADNQLDKAVEEVKAQMK